MIDVPIKMALSVKVGKGKPWERQTRVELSYNKDEDTLTISLVALGDVYTYGYVFDLRTFLKAVDEAITHPEDDGAEEGE